MKWTLNALFCGTLILALGTIFLSLYSQNSVGMETEEVVLEEDDTNFPYVKETVLSTPMESFDTEYFYKVNEPPKKALSHDRSRLLLGMAKRVSSRLNIDYAYFNRGSYRLLANGIEMNLYFGENWKRVSVFQPFAREIRVKEVAGGSNQKVNIILPLKGKMSAFTTFLSHLTTQVLPQERNLSLTIVYFNDDAMADAKALTAMALTDAVSPPSLFTWRFVAANDSVFSRGKGVRVGVAAAALRPDDLVFVCDVDVLTLPTFFSQCRANALYEKQVYFPVLFSLYNPELIYSLHDERVPPLQEQLTVGTDNGYWRYFGFGMFCMFKAEYDAVQGIPELSTWGREDLMFYEKFAQFKSIKVVRSLDTNIFHLYHAKNCSNVVYKSYPSCLTSKASNEGTQVQLALLLFKLHEGIDVEGILSKSCYAPASQWESIECHEFEPCLPQGIQSRQPNMLYRIQIPLKQGTVL